VQLALVVPTWRRVVELMGYQEDRPRFAFLFEPLRTPVFGALHAIRQGEIDVYLWALAAGVPGRDPQPWLAAALALAWAGLFAFCVVRLRAALAAAGGSPHVPAR
jgi:hypothetical protein